MEIHKIHRTYPEEGGASVPGSTVDAATGGVAALSTPGRHPVDCQCGGTGWIAVEDCVSGDLIDTRCPVPAK
jgi:hypothetical protein